MGLFDKHEDRKLTVDILAVLFGVGSWVGINSMFVQLPLLVISAPEAWSLPSYMSIAVQAANVGPILYAVYRKFVPNNGDKYWIVSLLSLGVIAALLMAFFHDHKTSIGGQDRSLIFLILVFATACVGCTSSVLFFPYMRHYKEIYVISYFIGEGLSGFVPSALALVQGIGGNPECVPNVSSGNSTIVYKDPRFSTRTFFLLNAFISLVSLCAFVLLTQLSICESEETSKNKLTSEKGDKYELNKVQPGERYEDLDTVSNSPSTTDGRETTISRIKASNLLALMAVVCAFGNGVFPSVQSYSCLPYGNLAYHLAVTLGSMANPAACFLALFLPRTSNRSISALTIVCAVFVGYTLATGLLSPTPPLYDHAAGVALVVLAWIAAIGLVSYIKLCISTIFRTQGGTWMFYCGAASQLGSAVGSLIIFVLINYAEIFKPSDPCL